MSSEASLSVGIVQIPENRIRKIICWIPRALSGTQLLENKIENLVQHVSSMTEVFHIILADVSGSWDSDKRERVQRMIANFTLVNKGLATVKAQGNPFTQEEIERLRYYTRQAQEGRIFSPEEATEYRQLSERASREYPGQQWVTELLKIALFIFALYALSEVLKSTR